MIYKDVNGDGKIDSNDLVVFNGGIAPIYGGFNTRVAYKRVDLSINAQYSIGKKVYAMYKETGSLNKTATAFNCERKTVKNRLIKAGYKI